MTIAYWSVLVIILLPYMWVMIARLPGFTFEKNLIPRQVADSFTGVRQRFYWAHLNALEAIAPFVAAVIIAHNLHLEQGQLNTLAMGFVGFRIAHALAYGANFGIIRSLMFVGGISCMVSLFIQAA